MYVSIACYPYFSIYLFSFDGAVEESADYGAEFYR